jgi:hypothetical protein
MTTINTFYNDLLSEQTLTPSGGGTFFYGEDKPQLLAPVYDTKSGSSYLPQGLQIKYDQTSSPEYVSYSSSNVNVYLDGYTNGTGDNVWKDPTKPFPVTLDTLDNKTISGVIKADLTYSGLDKPYPTNWTDLISGLSGDGGYMWDAHDVTTLVFQLRPRPGGTVTPLSKDKPLAVGTELQKVEDNTIRLYYTIISQFPPNITAPANENRFTTYDSNFKELQGSITIPLITPIIPPDNISLTNVASIWSINCSPGSATPTCQVSNSLIPGDWWTHTAVDEKKNLIKMLKIHSDEIVNSQSSSPGNYLVCKGTNYKNNTNYFYANDQKYFRGWFSGQYIGAYVFEKAFSPSIDKITYFDYNLNFNIITDNVNPLFKDIKGIINLNLKHLEALPILNSSLYIKKTVNDILFKGDSSLPKLGVYSSTLYSIKENKKMLEDTSTVISKISINDGNLIINYSGDSPTPPIEGDIYSMTFRSFILNKDLEYVLNYKGNMNSNIYESMKKDISLFGLNNKMSINNDVNIVKTNIYSGTLINPFTVKAFDSIVTLVSKGDEYITSKASLGQENRCDGNHVKAKLYESTTEFNKDHIFNVTLPTFSEPLYGNLSYGDVYSYVDEWMKNISDSYKSNPIPVNVCNMQFYNQPSPASCNGQECNYMTCSSLYECPGFSGDDMCEASGPSGLVMYNTFMKGFGIQLAVGKPIEKASAPAGGFVEIDTLLGWSKQNGKKVYPKSKGGAIMTWVVGTESSIVTAPELTAIVKPTDLQQNDTILYQYFDAFGGTGDGILETMPPALQQFLDSYNTDKQHIVPIFAFCDIGSDPLYGDLSKPWGGGSNWWTEDKMKIVQQNKDKYLLPSVTPGFIAPPTQVPVLVNGGAGQWASSSVILDTIGTPGKRTNTSTERIILSFGGQLVPMANLHSWDVDLLAQNLVNIVVKYGFDGVDFDLEGYDNSINGQSDIVWTANLYGSVKRYFLNYEKFINTDEGQKLGYLKDYTFWITDAPQPGYFRSIYWNAQATTSDMPPSTGKGCVCSKECSS